MTRPVITRPSTTGAGGYFARAKSDVDFIGSGSKLLDLALGSGGWAENRIANIVGDKSTGKTLLCIEISANFAIKYPKGLIYYRESEAAFLPDYAGALGMPLRRINFGEEYLETVEDLFEDLTAAVKLAKQKRVPLLYILDSLDGLSDRAEMERGFDEGSYGTAKAKNLSQMFRRITQQLSAHNVTLVVVSQVRDDIGAMFGRKVKRSGGRALDFYASQVVYLSQLGHINRTISGVKRPVGVNIRAKCDKNKVGLPFREAEFPIMFGYGIDDMLSCLEWLKTVSGTKLVQGIRVPPASSSKDELRQFVRETMRKPEGDFMATQNAIHRAVEQKWWSVERSFLPERKKYAT